MKKISLVILISAIVLSLCVQFYMVDKRSVRHDQALHYYDMKQHYESGKLATTGARFVGTQIISGENTTPRVPGGIFYASYVLFYKIAGESFYGAKVVNLIFNIIIIAICLFWFYKRFGLFITSIFSAFVLLNGYLVTSTTDFWNPNLTLVFSFLFLMLFLEYAYEKSEKNIKLSAIFIIPVLAIMAQGHFATFFSMVPTFIVYLIVRFKKTKKYLLYFAIGTLLAFLLYLPYLIYEMNTGFENIKLAFGTREGIKAFPFPQIHAVFIFPTNEISVLLGTRMESAKYFWLNNRPYIFGLVFLVLSVIFSFYCFIRAFVLFFKKRILIANSNKENSGVYKSLNEAILLLLLFFPSTIAGFVIGKSNPGTFRYIYSVYALSFIPIILFFIDKRNIINSSKRNIIITCSIILLNILALTIEDIRFTKMFEEPRSYKSVERLAKFFEENSNGEQIKIISKYSGEMPYAYNDIMRVFFTNYNINIPDYSISSDSTKYYYSLRDNIVAKNWTKERQDRDNSFIITNATELTDIWPYTIYKFNEGYRE